MKSVTLIGDRGPLCMQVWRALTAAGYAVVLRRDDRDDPVNHARANAPAPALLVTGRTAQGSPEQLSIWNALFSVAVVTRTPAAGTYLSAARHVVSVTVPAGPRLKDPPMDMLLAVLAGQETSAPGVVVADSGVPGSAAGLFPQGSRLHLGAGGKSIDGYINTDARRESAPSGIVVEIGVTELPLGRFSVIYASHVLEHVWAEDTARVLRDWYLALEPGGTVRISVPDLRLVLENCVETQRFASSPDGPLFGEMRKDSSPWDRHKRAFTEEILARCLKDAGFVHVRRWSVSQYPEIMAVRDWASYDTISLNLEAQRPAPGVGVGARG